MLNLCRISHMFINVLITLNKHTCLNNKLQFLRIDEHHFIHYSLRHPFTTIPSHRSGSRLQSRFARSSDQNKPPHVVVFRSPSTYPLPPSQTQTHHPVLPKQRKHCTMLHISILHQCWSHRVNSLSLLNPAGEPIFALSLIFLSLRLLPLFARYRPHVFRLTHSPVRGEVLVVLTLLELVLQLRALPVSSPCTLVRATVFRRVRSCRVPSCASRRVNPVWGYARARGLRGVRRVWRCIRASR